MSPIHRCNFSRTQRFLAGIVMIAIVGGGNMTWAQTSRSQSSGTLSPPVPLESGNFTESRVPTGTPPMSIGPATSFYPPPLPAPPAYGQIRYGFDGRPIYVGPPAFGPPPPAYGRPVFVDPRFAPPQPIPYAANLAPQARDFGPEPLPIPVEGNRPTGVANLRLKVSETFLNRLIVQERVEPGPVRDRILGADVTGRQTTVSKVRLDLKPSADKGTAAMVLNGDVQTLTTGVTPQAMIDTVGQQQFFAVKDVYFDGVQLSTRHATVFIRARNQTVGATTPLSGTLFGGIANRIAYAAAERQKAAGEAVARDRLAEKLFPTFDGEVDTKLSQANQQLESVRRQLETAKLMPASQFVWTTDTHLNHELFLGDPKAAAAMAPVNETAEGENGIRLSIHESLLNTIVDRAGLKGFKTTDKKLRELEKSLLSSLGITQPGEPESDGADLHGNGGALKPPLPAGTENFVTDIEFDDVEPLTLRLERDRLLVTIKAQFKPGGQEIVPPMTVTIPYQTRLVGDKIRWVAGTPSVVSQDRADPSAPPTIVEMAIQKVIEGDLIPIEFDRVLPAVLWTGSGPPPRIVSVKSDNGWCTIAVE